MWYNEEAMSEIICRKEVLGFMKAEYVSLLWNPAGTEIVERKVGERAPRGVIKVMWQDKTKTTYLVPTRATWMLTVKDEEGKVYEEDIYGIVKYYKQNVRVTINFRKKLEEHLMTYEFEVDGKFFKNLYKCIQEFLGVE